MSHPNSGIPFSGHRWGGTLPKASSEWKPEIGSVWRSEFGVSRYRVDAIEQTYDEETGEPLGEIVRTTNLSTGGSGIQPLSRFRESTSEDSLP